MNNIEKNKLKKLIKIRNGELIGLAESWLDHGFHSVIRDSGNDKDLGLNIREIFNSQEELRSFMMEEFIKNNNKQIVFEPCVMVEAHGDIFSLKKLIKKYKTELRSVIVRDFIWFLGFRVASCKNDKNLEVDLGCGFQSEEELSSFVMDEFIKLNSKPVILDTEDRVEVRDKFINLNKLQKYTVAGEIIEQLKTLFEGHRQKDCHFFIHQLFNSKNSCKDTKVLEYVREYIFSTDIYFEIILIRGLDRRYCFFPETNYYLLTTSFLEEMSLSSEPEFVKKYSFYVYYNERIIAVSNTEEEYHLLDVEGTIYYKSKDIISHCDIDHFIVSEKGRFGVLNKNGEFVVPPIYDMIKDEMMWHFPIKKAGKCFYLNRFGKKPFCESWEDVQPFKQGRAFVKKDGKWGLIDCKGRLIIDYKFQEAWDMVGRRTLVRYNEQLHVLSLSGELRKIDRCDGEIVPLFNFGLHGIATIRDGENYYAINEKGETLCEDVYVKNLFKNKE